MREEIDQLRDGIFQMEMGLYKAYAKYLSPSEAKYRAYLDVIDQASKMGSGSMPAVSYIERLIDNIKAAYKKTADSNTRYELAADIDTLESALNIIKHFEEEI